MQTLDSRIRRLRLSRNFGHQAALSAGLDHAEGDALVMLDADLQDPPELVPEFVARWREGFAVVFGRRTRRRGERRLRLWLTAAYYRSLNWLSEIRLEPNVADFRLLDRRVVLELRGLREQDRYLRGLVQWVGFSQCAVDYEREPRIGGRSKFTWRKLLALASHGLFSFGISPFPLFASAALVMLVLAGMLVGLQLLGLEAGLIWGLNMGLLFVGQALCLLCLACVGAYARRVYGALRQRPNYIVEHLDAPDRRHSYAVIPERLSAG